MSSLRAGNLEQIVTLLLPMWTQAPQPQQSDACSPHAATEFTNGCLMDLHSENHSPLLHSPFMSTCRAFRNVGCSAMGNDKATGPLQSVMSPRAFNGEITGKTGAMTTRQMRNARIRHVSSLPTAWLRGVCHRILIGQQGATYLRATAHHVYFILIFKIHPRLQAL